MKIIHKDSSQKRRKVRQLFDDKRLQIEDAVARLLNRHPGIDVEKPTHNDLLSMRKELFAIVRESMAKRENREKEIIAAAFSTLLLRSAIEEREGEEWQEEE